MNKSYQGQEMLNVYKQDPIGYIIDKTPGDGITRIVLLSILIYSFFILALGAVISISYKGTFISIFDSRELPLVLSTTLLFFPAIWATYQWQAQGTRAALSELADNGVFENSKGKFHSDKYFDDFILSRWNRRINLTVNLTVTLLALIVFSISTYFNPSGLITMAIMKDKLWWNVYPLYFFLLWMPLENINVYMIVWVIVRQIFVVQGFNILLKKYSLHPKLFHPDKCNGLAPIGNYAIRSTLIVIILGTWVALQIISPAFYGKPINFNIATTLQLLFYTFAAPALLIPTVWKTHIAMKKAKRSAIEAIAKQIRLLLDVESSNQLKAMEKVKSLKEKLEIVDNEMKTWPFKKISVRNFGIASITPLMFSTISFVFQQYLTKIIHFL